MTAPETREEPKAAMPPPRRRRRWLTALLFAIVFLAGIVCGGGLTAVGVVRAARENAQHPEARPERTARWLARYLKLDAPQRQRVLTILKEQNAEFLAIRHEAWPRVAQRLQTTQDEIAGTLTPEQQKKWQTLVARIRANWLPRE